MSEQKIKGSCHCGFIKYTFTPPPKDPSTNQLTATRCNCTFCQKLRTTNLALPNGASDFELLSPASREEIPTYAPRVKTVQRYFCAKCGVHVWMEGHYEHGGHKIPLFMVNLATVDQPQEGVVDLSTDVSIKYYDLLHNNFAGGLSEKPWPGGLL